MNESQVIFPDPVQLGMEDPPVDAACQWGGVRIFLS